MEKLWQRSLTVLVTLLIAVPAKNLYAQVKTCEEELVRASTAKSMHEFYKFCKCYDELPSDQKREFKSNGQNREALRALHRQLFARDWNDTLFSVHLFIRKYFSSDAEASEGLDAYFSNEFVRNLPRAITALDSVHDKNRLVQLVDSATDVEGNAEKIVSYLRDMKLTNKTYYNLFLEKATFLK